MTKTADTLELSPNQLRAFLFEFEDQEMTIKELRNALFQLARPFDDTPIDAAGIAAGVNFLQD